MKRTLLLVALLPLSASALFDWGAVFESRFYEIEKTESVQDRLTMFQQFISDANQLLISGVPLEEDERGKISDLLCQAKQSVGTRRRLFVGEASDEESEDEEMSDEEM